jgi:hypothetical protein
MNPPGIAMRTAAPNFVYHEIPRPTVIQYDTCHIIKKNVFKGGI